VGPGVPPNNCTNDGFSTVLAAVPGNVTTARHQVAHWLRNIAVDLSRAQDIVLAVNEAVTNAIEHGSGCDESKFVSVQAAVLDDAVIARVSDSGHWIHSVHHPVSSTRGGRGLILIKELTNSVDVFRTATGTHVTMRFDIA
jgi:anti-sigma regulatory factor (Ser/Thr protein kinase)